MLRRRLMKSDGDFVNLGLPSGLLWAKGNIVKNGSEYKIGAETERGCYFSWGNVDGHEREEQYDFSEDTYYSTLGADVEDDIEPNDASHDAAFACLGSPCHLPTKDNILELYNNTDTEWTTINGVTGRKFMKKTNHSVYIFFPITGILGEDGSYYKPNEGYCWSSTIYEYDSNEAYYILSSNSGSPLIKYTHHERYYGCTVRAVK